MKTSNLKFTEKEIQILKELAVGKNCNDIATKMNIKISTVYTHCRNMLEKFNQKKMIGVILFAIKKGYLRKIKL